MGMHINVIDGKLVPSRGKVSFILSNIKNSVQIPEPKEFTENLVCVVDNIMFQSAAYCYSESEMKEFLQQGGSSKTWLIVPDAESYC